MRTKIVQNLFLILMLAVAVAGYAVPETPDFSKGILDPATVIADAENITTERYPNADDVLVDDFIWVRYAKDGTSITWDDTWMKVLTEKGKRENQSLSFHYTLPYGTVTLPVLQIVKPDGTVIDIDVAAQSKEMINPSQQSSNIYNPNSKVLQVGVAGLEVGDMVRYVSRREVVKARVPDTFSDYSVMEYTSPIRKWIYEVHGPEDMPLVSIALKGEVEGTVTHTQEVEDGENVYRWEVRDVPRMYEEPNMPPLYTVVQRLLISTIPDWETISKWYWDLSEPHFATTPEIDAKVAELIDGADDMREKIERIFYWVSQEIRYMGITTEDEAPGYEPHPASMTFENRHGVCRDKAALLVAMLREAGLDAFPVLIHNGPKKDEEVPQPYFNHAVVAVDDPEGGYILMDATDENTRELFPAYLNNQSYLVARPGGEKLLTSPIIPAEENLMRIHTRAKIDASGKLTAESELDFEGINDNAYRGYLSRIQPEERRRYFEGVVKALQPGARLTRFELTPDNLLDTTENLRVEMAFEADDVPVRGEEATMLPTFFVGTRVGMVNFVLRATGLKERTYPLKTDIACGVEEKLELEFDPALGEVEALPEYPTIEDDALLWRTDMEVEEQDGRRLMHGNARFLLKVVEFSPEQYLTLKDTLRELEYNGRKMPILKTPEDADQPDVVLESVMVDYAVRDMRNWTETRTYRKKVLTYKGKKDEGEVHVDYNPAWEDVELLYARVVNGEDVKEISEEEINIMDAGWVASAPRYPGAKRLVASLPGVEVGSMIEYAVRTTSRDKPFFSTTEVFRSTNPLTSKTVTVRFAEDADLWWHWGGENGLRMDETDAGAIAPLSASLDKEATTRTLRVSVQGQPRVKPEPDLPPWWSFNPAVRMTTREWEDYGGEVTDALDEAADADATAAEKAREILDGVEDSENQIVTVRDFVARNIRAAGPGLGALPLSAISGADTTLADGYGNTSDRAVLLYAMLDEAGLDPEFVLTGRLPRVEELREVEMALPDAGALSTVLVRVPVDQGFIYLNDTDQYAALGATSYDGLYGLVDGGGRWEMIEALKPELAENAYDLKIASDGTTTMTVHYYMHGTRFGHENRRYAEMPPEERNRHFQEMVSGVSQGAEAVGSLVTDFSKYPGEVQFTVNIDRYAVRDGNWLYGYLPETLGGVFGYRSDERTNPVYWAGPRRSLTRTEITLPDAFDNVVLAPDEVEWDAPNAGGVLLVETGSSGDTLSITHRVDLLPWIVAPEDYGSLLEIDRRLRHDRARTVLLRSGAEE